MEEYISSFLCEHDFSSHMQSELCIMYNEGDRLSGNDLDIVYRLYKDGIFDVTNESYRNIVIMYCAIYYLIVGNYDLSVNLYDRYVNYHLNGSGFIRMYHKFGMKLFEKGVEKGNTCAMMFLADAYYDHSFKGIERDCYRAIEFCHMAMMAGKIDLNILINLASKGRTYYEIIRHNLYKYYKKTGDIEPFQKICKDDNNYIKRKDKQRDKKKKLEERIAALEQDIERLMYAPNGPMCALAHEHFDQSVKVIACQEKNEKDTT